MILCAKPYILKEMHIMAPRGHDMHTRTCILGRKPGGAGVVVVVIVVVVVVI